MQKWWFEILMKILQNYKIFLLYYIPLINLHVNCPFTTISCKIVSFLKLFLF